MGVKDSVVMHKVATLPPRYLSFFGWISCHSLYRLAPARDDLLSNSISFIYETDQVEGNPWAVPDSNTVSDT